MRSFTSPFPGKFLASYQRGVMAYQYKNVPCLKSPIDIAIYMRAIWALKPATIFEIGSRFGGSALLFADIARTYRAGAEVVSIDVKPPQNPAVEGVNFLSGDVMSLGQTFSANLLHERPHPWLVVEDSAHTYKGCMAALSFFAEHLEAGELLVIEDGILDELGLSEKYFGGPNQAIKDFFDKCPDVFEVDKDLCDMFGTNATYNPNGYLRRL